MTVKTKQAIRAIDIGYGYLKYIEKGDVKKEKAVIAELGQSLSTGNALSVDIIKVDGVTYVVGEGVYKLGLKPIVANETVNRASNVVYKVLALYALAKTYDGNESHIVVTGLPFQNLDEADTVKDLLTNEHKVILNDTEIIINVVETKVAAQGLGTYHALLNQRGISITEKSFLLVDIGFKTINYLPIFAGNIDVKNVKTTRNLGIQRAYTAISDAANIDLKREYQFYNVDELLDKGAVVQTLDKGLTHEPIKDKQYVAEALTEYANDIWNDIFSKYNEAQREQFEEIVFAGGSAQRAKEFIETTKKHYCTFIENSQEAQVLGYEAIAKQVLGV